MKAKLLFWWHVISFAKKFRYEYAWGGWSEWCDYHYATLGIENSKYYTGRVQYDAWHKEPRRKVAVVVTRDTEAK